MKATQLSVIRWAATGAFVLGGGALALQLGTDIGPAAGWLAVLILAAIVAFPLWVEHSEQAKAEAAARRYAEGPGRFTADEAPEMRSGPERFAAEPAGQDYRPSRGGDTEHIADPEAGLPPWENST